jgi:serine/threonine protein kinase
MLDHPNIVGFKDCFDDDENVYMGLELCEKGVSQPCLDGSSLCIWSEADGPTLPSPCVEHDGRSPEAQGGD